MLHLNNHPIKLTTFPNKEHRLDLPTEYLEKHNTVLWQFESDASIFELLLFDRAMTQLDESYDLTISYMPYSRMDRIQKENTAFSLELLCDLFSIQLDSLNKLFVLDPHSPITLKLLHEFGVTAQEVDYSLAKNVIDYTQVDLNNAWVVFPDKGAAGRYKAEDYPNVIICEKTRDFATGKITDMTAHVHTMTTKPDEKAPILIIDDLCSYGGTFIRAVDTVKKLEPVRSNNAWLIVTHAEEALEKGAVLETFDKVFCTDSIATPANHKIINEDAFDPTHQVYVKPVANILKEL